MRKTRASIFCVTFFLGACASKHGAVPEALKSAEAKPTVQTTEQSAASFPRHDEGSHHADTAHAVPAVDPVKPEVHGAAVPAFDAAKTEGHGAAHEAPISSHVESVKKDEHTVDPHASHNQKNETHSEMSAVGAKQLQWLKNGNARFVKNHQRNDFKSRAEKMSMIEKLSAGQKPHTIVLSCSDSRVPPELVFDQVMGEIFVIRVAGEALDSSVIASIEYAAEHLGTELVVVMGHESCGAVKAAIGTPEGQTAGSPSLDKLVGDIKPRLAQTLRSPAGASSNLHDESFANAKGVARDLLSRSPVISELSSHGKLRIVSALYQMKSGVVEFE